MRARARGDVEKRKEHLGYNLLIGNTQIFCRIS